MKLLVLRALSALGTLAILAAGLSLHAIPAAAQGWTTKPIRVIVPFPPGGTTDQIIRRIQPLLEAELGTKIVVENRAGASGSVGTKVVATAEADGTTFLMVFDTHGVNPSLLPNLPFDTLNDLAPIILIGKSPMVITAHKSTAYARFADVLDAAKNNPAAISYGTIGAGSLAHLAMSQIAGDFKVSLTHVPYKGGGPLVTDAVGGHVPLAIASIALFSPHIRSGSLRPLAVTSATRHPTLPDTPTIAELGLAGFDAESWWGMLAPAKTPPDIIARMHDAVVKALQDPTVKANLSEQGVDYVLSSPPELQTFIAAEIARWAQVIKENKIVLGE
jgi:tripartite-type tricarboxylate transporter receptor subunit TctC